MIHFASTLRLLTVFSFACASQSPDEIVAASRSALGWDKLLACESVLEIEGAARFLDTDARQRICFDGRGRFFDHIEGPLAQSTGFDGVVWWARDWNKIVREQVLGDRSRSEVTALLLTGGWSAPFAPLTFELGSGAGAGELLLDFHHRDGVLTGSLVLDASSYLPLRATLGMDSTPMHFTFEEMVRHEDFAFPSRISYGQHNLVQSLSVESLTRQTAEQATLFAATSAPGAVTIFRADAPSKLEVRRVPSGHLLVHPLVDGTDVGWFIFDSGAGTNCLSLAAAKALELEPFGAIGARGIGGTVRSSFFQATLLELGPLTLKDPILLGLDLAFLTTHFGVEVGGILGYELLSHCVAELEFDEPYIALFDPQSYRLPEAGHWEEALLYARHPHLHGAVEGHEGWFTIDTGAAGDTLTLHYQSVADLGFLDGRATRAGNAGGVGGLVPTRIGELSSLRLGSHEFGPVEAEFSLQDKGAFSDDYVLGNIGGKLFAPFRLVFDYPNRRVGLVPR